MQIKTKNTILSSFINHHSLHLTCCSSAPNLYADPRTLCIRLCSGPSSGEARHADSVPSSLAEAGAPEWFRHRGQVPGGLPSARPWGYRRQHVLPVAEPHLATPQHPASVLWGLVTGGGPSAKCPVWARGPLAACSPDTPCIPSNDLKKRGWAPLHRQDSGEAVHLFPHAVHVG